MAAAVMIMIISVLGSYQWYGSDNGAGYGIEEDVY